MKRIELNKICVRAVAGAAAFFIGMTPVNVSAHAPKEEPEETTEEEVEVVKDEPLTPEGNMELVDDLGTVECGGKQFITVVTKSGNYFYIIIDRDNQGNENVHFLNMVDERDLLTLMDDEEVKEYMDLVKEEEEPEPVPTPVPEPSPEPEPTPAPEPVKKDYTLLLIVLPIAALGMIFAYFALKKKRQQPKDEPDLDVDYMDEENEYFNQIGEEDGNSDD